MTVWQYAQLRVTYENRVTPPGDRWSTVWHGPVAPTRETAQVYDDVVAELNRAGTEGWELVDVAALPGRDSAPVPDETDWSLTRYTFRRPCDSTAKGTVHRQWEETERSVATRTNQPDHLPAGSMTAEAALVRLTVCWLANGEPAGSATEGSGRASAAGQLLIKREAAYPRSPADIGLIAFFRAEFEDPEITGTRRQRLKSAVADYAASWVEGQFGTWWASTPNLLLPEAGQLLDNSADWLRGLVAHPLAQAASHAGAAGLIVPVGAGIAAEFVTEPLTAPLENSARVCELAGIVIGLATGAHPLVMACATRFARDEAGQVLSKSFEQVISAFEKGHDAGATYEPTYEPDYEPQIRRSLLATSTSPSTVVAQPPPSPYEQHKKGVEALLRPENPRPGPQPPGPSPGPGARGPGV